MKIVITTKLILDPDDVPTKTQVLNAIEGLKSKLLRINDEETSFLSVEKTYHDEIPTKPCETILYWEKE